MYRFRIIIALLLTAAIMTGCSIKPAEKPPIRIAISTWPGYAHAFIAQEKGFFKENGVDVELVFKKEYSDALELYKNGEVSGVFEVFTDSVFHDSQGLPTKAVYVADYSDTGDVIVGRPELGSLLDLKEKPVGIDGADTFSHLFVLSALIRAGLKESDLRFEIVSALDVPKALDEGRIFAGHTWEPAKSEALGKGYKILAKAGDIPGVIVDVLAFNADVAEKRRSDIKAVIKALFEAQNFVQNNREESIAIMAKADGMTPEEMDSGIKGVIQPNLTQNKLILEESGDPEDLVNIAKMIYDFYGKRGRYFNEQDIYDIIDDSFLK